MLNIENKHSIVYNDSNASTKSCDAMMNCITCKQISEEEIKIKKESKKEDEMDSFINEIEL